MLLFISVLVYKEEHLRLAHPLRHCSGGCLSFLCGCSCSCRTHTSVTRIHIERNSLGGRAVMSVKMERRRRLLSLQLHSCPMKNMRCCHRPRFTHVDKKFPLHLCHIFYSAACVGMYSVRFPEVGCHPRVPVPKRDNGWSLDFESGGSRKDHALFFPPNLSDFTVLTLKQVTIKLWDPPLY